MTGRAVQEIRTWMVKAGAVAEVEARAAARLATEERPPGLAAFWHTEIGPLNQIVQVWRREDPARRAEEHAAGGDAAWPPDVLDLLVSEQTEVWRPAPFMRPLEPAEYGGLFEMRTYAFQPGTLPRMLEVWARALPRREELSPLVACWTSEGGTLHRLCHVWTYPSLDERARLRKEALTLPNWPPATREWRVSEENKILIPAAFSPIR